MDQYAPPIHRLGFVELVTTHKLIGGMIALAAIVFLVSVVKIIAAVIADKEKKRSQD